jgi:hypothetical protein
MAFCTSAADPTKTISWTWEEVETVPELLQIPEAVAAQTTTATSKYATVQQHAVEKKVQFAVVTTLHSLPWPKAPSGPPAQPIPDFCSVLCQKVPDLSLKKYLGSISDECDAQHRYCFYLVEKHEVTVETQSLDDLLTLSLPSPRPTPARPAFLFSRRDRLLLAATLASCVLQFHGSWLKTSWRSKDILFPKLQSKDNPVVDHPYLSGHQVSGAVAGPPTATTTNPLIANEILFPLGLVLVELSLCQSISALRTPEDDDPVEAYANLKTALRYLDRVYTESGCKYGDVVTSCFRWSETRNSSADDDDFQQLVFQKIVSPLVEELKDFEGKGRIH